MLNFRTVNFVSIVLFIAILIGGFYIDTTLFWFFILLFFAWLTLTSIGSFNILWNYFLKANCQNKNTKENSIALTFDDGINPEFTPEVLELLKKHNAKATFFCIGKHIEKHPEIAKKIITDGHTIGNHTYNHSNNWGFLSSEKVENELKKTDKIIETATGKSTKLFRPPFGVTNPNIAKVIQKLDYKVIGWSIRSLDTVIKNPERILKRITSKVKKGDIILLHDTNQKSIDVLEQLLLFLDENNLKSVCVEKLLNI